MITATAVVDVIAGISGDYLTRCVFGSISSEREIAIAIAKIISKGIVNKSASSQSRPFRIRLSRVSPITMCIKRYFIYISHRYISVSVFLLVFASYLIHSPHRCRQFSAENRASTRSRRSTSYADVGDAWVPFRVLRVSSGSASARQTCLSRKIGP